MTFRKSFLYAATLVAAAAMPAAAEYPERPVKMVVNFSAGGATHTLGRLFAEQFEKKLGGTIAVTAVAGAGGAIGAAQVARAKADGYTLLFGSNGTAGQRWQVSEAGFDDTSFEPIASVAALPTSWAVKTDSPVKTMKDLVAHLKANPGTKYASVGTASSLHVSSERWAGIADIKIDHIGARGGRGAIVKLMSGEVEFISVAANNFPRETKDGKEANLRPLAVASPERYPYTPKVPTMKEIGYDLVDVTWWGVFAPKGIPEEARNKLVTAAAEAAQAPKFLDILKRFYYVPHYLSPEEVEKDLKQHIAESRTVLMRIGLHKDAKGQSGNK